MISSEPPQLETRSSNEIADHVAARARVPLDGSDQMGEGLVRVFARYFEILADRLNRVPKKNHLAFLRLLGTKPAPPTAARVPLTFFPVKQLAQREQAEVQSNADLARAYVPLRTQVAAAPDDGAGEPIVFETERALELTSVTLKKIIALDAVRDRVADYTDLAAGASPGVRLFADRMRAARHDFYIAKPAGLGNELSNITIHFEIEPQGQGQDRRVEWTLPGEKSDVRLDTPLDTPFDTRLSPNSDTTAGITKSGNVTFLGLPKWPIHKLNEIDCQWLRCTLVSRLACLPVAESDEDRMPRSGIRRIEMSGGFALRDQAPQRGFFNGQPLDISTGFFPLGPAPRFGDVFYLGSQLFANADAQVVVRIDLANPVSETRPPPNAASIQVARPRLIWEAPSAGKWAALECEDTTHELTESGTVSFKLPSGAGAIAVNGIEGGWIRARFTGGSHPGREAVEKLLVEAGKGPPGPPVAWVPFAPAVESIKIDASKSFPRLPVRSIVIADDFDVATVALPAGVAVEPFRRVACDRTALYLGLEGAIGAIENRTASLYAFVAEPAGSVVSNTEPRQKWMLSRCEYWDGYAWTHAGVADETRGFTESGSLILSFAQRAHPASAPQPRQLCWVRLLWPVDQIPADATVERIALNTVMAINAVTSENELLGSSNHAPDQIFRCARVPVLKDIHLEVREPQSSGAEGRARMRSAEGENIVGRDAAGVTRETWVRWRLVSDFSLSGPEDRHFVLEPSSGQVSFGNGQMGKIPPAGANNLRVRRYRSGGGSRGNVAANSVKEPRTTIPYVTGVTNLVEAIGGGDAEGVEHSLARGGSALRHRDRAVTREDYEDLAAAVPQIARAKCLPLRDLALDPDGDRIYPGCVSVIIVPQAGDAAPRPTASQLRIVQDLLAGRKQPGVSLTVAGAEYVRIDVAAELVCGIDENLQAVAARCQARLREYLHPSTGGPAGKGWPFAERPTQLALNVMLRRVEGVEQVRSLTVHLQEQRPRLLKSHWYLVCSGEHHITCVARAQVDEDNFA